MPSGTAMTEGDLDRVIDTILNGRKKAQKTQDGLKMGQISRKKAQEAQKGF